MELSTAQKLQIYIKAELGDAQLYRQLADMAPNDHFRQLLLEFAQDEQAHATEFQRIYRIITGSAFTPEVPPTMLQGSFFDILRERVLDESGDFRKYGEQFILCDSHTLLRRAYYRARTDENVHALRLLYMLS